ncbi:hypothetical protein PIB30_068036 [Stylosanthes scabra]|uniref:Inner centromere protein ARK-binding domain-containing protein n=1 Tax=Stylosanthes scabra TaxID=79078 RepID=A0ABU6UQ87_9FABA|nr:hypothetical protein [Stylosanthes scabra]
MSAKEKQVAQIFERKKWIIEQARQQCLAWEQHLYPNLILHGIPPPPWLSNYSLPKELDKDDLVSEVLFSQPPFGVPFSSHRYSLYSNLGVVSEAALCQSGLQNDVHAPREDYNKGDRLSNLPDCSVNNDGCASSGPPELDSGAISPQNQMEPRVSDSFLDPAVSLAKLQRSKPRQRALELRNSAQQLKCRLGDDNNAGICAGTITGSGFSILQADDSEEPELTKDFNSNIQVCSTKEVKSHRQTQTSDKVNYSGRITRSKRLAQKLNSSNVASSSVVKEDDTLNNLGKPLELVDQPLFTNERCEAEEGNKKENQMKEARSSAYHATQFRSSRQSRYNSEILKLESTVDRGKGAEVEDSMQPFAPVELTNLSKSSDQNNGSRKNIVEDGNFCNNKESQSCVGIDSLRNSISSPVDDFLMTGHRGNSINKSEQSFQPLVSQHSQDCAVSVVDVLCSQKDPDFCAVKSKERLSRSGSGMAKITTDSKSHNHIEDISKPLSSNFCNQIATCSDFGGEKSQNQQLAELDAGRLSSSDNFFVSDAEVIMNPAEKENIVESAIGNTTDVTTFAAEGFSRPVAAFNFDGGSLLVKSLYSETSVAEKILDGQEIVLSGAIPNGNIEDKADATFANVHADLDGLVGQPPCLGTRVTVVSPRAGMDVLDLGMPSGTVMSVLPKQLNFDHVEESSVKGISSPDTKEGQKDMSPEEPQNLLLPVNELDHKTSLDCQVTCKSLDKLHVLDTEEALIREGPQMEYRASHFEEADVARKAKNVVSPEKKLAVVQKESCVPTSSLKNSSSPLQVASQNSSANLSKEVKASKSGSVRSKLEIDESNVELGDLFSAVDTGDILHKYTDETVSNFTVGVSSDALIDQVIVEAPNNISLCEKIDLLRQKWLSDEKDITLSTEFQIFKSSGESSVHDVNHSFPQHKRRKMEIEEGKFLPSSSGFLEKPLYSIDQKSVSRDLCTEDNPEALQDQYLTSDQGVDTEEMQCTQPCETMEGSSHKVSIAEKLLLDGRNRSVNNLPLEDKRDDSWHPRLHGGQESAQRLTCVEDGNSEGRIYLEGTAKFSDILSVSSGIKCADLIDTDVTVPEFDGFIMPTNNTHACTTGDQIEFEKMDPLGNSVDYSSLGKSRFMHSPFCYSSTPCKLHTIPGPCQSLPNGLLEGMNLRTSLPQNDESTRALSDCLPNSKVQYTPSIQTLWDKINAYGSSGKRSSLKLELPCISEENENVDEVADTSQKGIGSEGMTSSTTLEPLTDIMDSAKPSAAALQDDMLTEGSTDFVDSQLNFSGAHDKLRKKLDKKDCNRKRFKSKGKENQSVSLGANGAKRTTESLSRPSRSKLSGKDSLKQGSTISIGKTSYNNIVSNVTSFIPLVQQKQSAAVAVAAGKRDVKVKALEAAEAAKRMAEKKENERKMKKEALRIEREKLEQHNQRQQELQKKKKEEERKKKDAEMAAKKRQREEEKKEKERKRKRLNDAKKQQHEQEKMHAKKEDKQVQSRATGEQVRESKKLMDERENHQKLQVHIKEGNMEVVSASEPLNTRNLANDKIKESCPAYSEAVSDGANKEMVKGNLIKAPEDDAFINEHPFQEQSYDISPYKESDDEDEDEDDKPNNKFIPSWASKHCLSLAASSQKMDPETIFPRRSFCNIAEVLLPRKLQSY